VATSMTAFIAELRAFDGRRVVVRALRRKINKPLPALRDKIREHAVTILPHGGGLGAWVAAARISSSVRYASARTAGVKIKGSRQSTRGKSDLQRIDAGTVRAPSWGRRSAGSWHVQTVPSGWFTTPASDNAQWVSAIESAVDEAFDQIRRG